MKIFLSIVFFTLAFIFATIGVMLFNICSNVTTISYTNFKEVMLITGCFFSFVLAFGFLVGSIISLISSFY